MNLVNTESFWVVLELSSRGCEDDPDVVVAALNKLAPKAEFYLPVIVTKIGGDRTIRHLVEGYAFVKPSAPSDLRRLAGTKYVISTLMRPGKRVVATVDDAAVTKLRAQVETLAHQGIGVGDLVLVTTGPYKNLEAAVIEDIPEIDMVQVLVKLRSKESIITLPRSGLDIIKKAPLSAFSSRLTALMVWLRERKPIILWRDGLEPISRKLGQLGLVYRLASVASRVHNLLVFAFGSEYSNRLKKIQGLLEKLTYLTELAHKGRSLHAFVTQFDSDLWVQTLHKRLRVLRALDKTVQAVDKIGDIVESVVRETEDAFLPQNILVDGLNLACRCQYALGLQDSKGRSTGMIYGFLRSLGSLKKRFSGARLYIVWDSRSERRYKLFGAYKANRVSATAALKDGGFDQLGHLQNILDHLEIDQVWPKDEEADDAIATLVRGSLKEQTSLIFSTDRDFLQLVSSTVRVLLPGAGSRKEVLHDVASVEEVFGVDPPSVLELRAFLGDTSDNIPGVSRVPKKLLRALVKAYGSVEGVYKSNLTGLTRSQYDKVRTAEPQVRLNLLLMVLVDTDLKICKSSLALDEAVRLLRDVEIDPSVLDPLISLDNYEHGLCHPCRSP